MDQMAMAIGLLSTIFIRYSVNLSTLLSAIVIYFYRTFLYDIVLVDPIDPSIAYLRIAAETYQNNSGLITDTLISSTYRFSCIFLLWLISYYG